MSATEIVDIYTRVLGCIQQRSFYGEISTTSDMSPGRWIVILREDSVDVLYLASIARGNTVQAAGIWWTLADGWAGRL
ncbi:hypothetical protein An11g07480 [Aspergillus niger]|uniref:Uncharacterized protein n=2 Tax=Aspergillus niger TaxID=5061 RepID=A2QX36_ASPNC|nr:hypothetical protein An11g07480 [Aspergillus niger]CAK40792.1 hypothetical protein An11g07480 [Aspergillus niger]